MYRMVLLSVAVLVLAVACGDGGTGPTPEPGLYGWAVGAGSGDAPVILKTEDGIEWTALDTGLSLPGASLGSVSVVDSSTVWAAGGLSEGFGVVIKTTDGGETWLRMGNESQIPKSILAVKAFSADVAWICGDNNSIYRTVDGGMSWEDMSSPEYTGYGWQGIDGTGPTNVWISGGTQNNGALLHTSDGIIWTYHAGSLVEDWPMISVAALDQNNVWAVGHGFTIVKSSDGGIEWELVTPDSLQGSGNDANGIALLSSTEAWVALDYGNIWKTTDSGATWEYQTVPSEAAGFFMLRISAIDQNSAWVTGGSAEGSPEGIILHTSDGGETWTRQDDGTVPFLWDVGFTGEFN